MPQTTMNKQTSNQIIAHPYIFMSGRTIAKAQLMGNVATAIVGENVLEAIATSVTPTNLTPSTTTSNVFVNVWPF
eukprot:gnl/Chilomastix_caulleri/4157.p1 GENE.gnl/Chilomastix_caulleri/4157~~gnl/Chilomastix_caulleri/4157.p1  ORF type:complete len:75 (-),score=10.27 gnl/Chilomastix_caulleri/4157:54-278(-)